MPLQRYEPKFTVIDLDPHWVRVIRFFRPSDYLTLFGGTMIGPLVHSYETLFSHLNARTPWKISRSQLNPSFWKGMFVPTLASFIGGFFLAYHRSSERFWGWKENQREIEMDRRLYLQARQQGRPHHLGESELDPFLKGVAYRHSRFAAEAFAWLPLLNFTHHNLGVNWELYKDLEPQV